MSDIKWNYIFDPQLAIDSFPYVMEGIGYTILISLISMLAGLIIGFFLALARTSKYAILRWPTRTYISFMRGVPILVILFMLYFGLPIIGLQLSPLEAALIAFSVNSAAYIAEIIRSALSSVDNGQWESSKALGLTYWQTMFGIILPQSIRIATPPLANVQLDIIKASSLAAMITVPEIFQKARIVGGREFDFMTMYIVVALIYWGLCSIMTVLQNYLEKRYEEYL